MGNKGRTVRNVVSSPSIGKGFDPFTGVRFPRKPGGRPGASRATGPRSSVLGGALGRPRPLPEV